jgi:O-antigen/teichoic acid export membrane protein
VPTGAIAGLERYRDAALISAFCSVVTICFTIYALQVSSVEIAMIGIIVSTVLQALAQSILVLKLVDRRVLLKKKLIDKEGFSVVVGFAGPMFSVSLISASSVWLVGRLLLSYGDELDFALYSIGMQWYGFGLLIPGVVSRVLLPRLVSYSSSRDQIQLIQSKLLIRKGLLVCLATGLLLVAVVFPLSPWLITLYGDKYYSYYWLILFFCLASIIAAPINTLGNALLARDEPILWLKFNVVALFALLATCIASLSMGVWTGALSHAVSALTICFLAIRALRLRELI